MHYQAMVKSTLWFEVNRVCEDFEVLFDGLYFSGSVSWYHNFGAVGHTLPSSHSDFSDGFTNYHRILRRLPWVFCNFQDNELCFELISS